MKIVGSHIVLTMLLLIANSTLAADNVTTPLATTLKQRDQDVQRKDNNEKTTRELIHAAKERLEREYIAASWDMFSELKRQGVRFKTNLRLPDNPMCASKILDQRSNGEFTVYRAHCDSVYVNFWPEGSKNAASISATIVQGTRAMNDFKFDSNCNITIDLLADKTYTCPDLMKPETSAIIRRDVREIITKQLSKPPS